MCFCHSAHIPAGRRNKDNKDFTDSWGQLDTNWQFPLLRKVGAVIVEQSDESVSSQTNMRLVAHRQLLCVGITADCLEKQEQPNKETLRHMRCCTPTAFFFLSLLLQLTGLLQHTIHPRVLASLRNTIKTGIAEQGVNTLWCLLRKLQELEQSYNRPAVMNPILAIKHLCDLLYWSN